MINSYYIVYMCMWNRYLVSFTICCNDIYITYNIYMNIHQALKDTPLNQKTRPFG